jgi:hypothetical protein
MLSTLKRAQVVGQIRFLLLLINHNVCKLVLLRKNYSHYAKQYLVKKARHSTCNVTEWRVRVTFILLRLDTISLEEKLFMMI